MNQQDSLRSLIFALLGAAIAGLFFWASLSIPAPRFEPVGSALVPQLIAVVIWTCAIAEIWRWVEGRGTHDNELPEIEYQTSSAMKLLVLRIMYIGLFSFFLIVLGTEEIAFSLLSAVLFFVTAVMTGVSRSKKSLILTATFGLAFGIFVELIFTRVFFVNIPTLG